MYRRPARAVPRTEDAREVGKSGSTKVGTYLPRATANKQWQQWFHRLLVTAKTKSIFSRNVHEEALLCYVVSHRKYFPFTPLRYTFTLKTTAQHASDKTEPKDQELPEANLAVSIEIGVETYGATSGGDESDPWGAVRVVVRAVQHKVEEP